jgi:hydroxyethylthiazole kinase-like sugar kinase family protein
MAISLGIYPIFRQTHLILRVVKKKAALNMFFCPKNADSDSAVPQILSACAVDASKYRTKSNVKMPKQSTKTAILGEQTGRITSAEKIQWQHRMSMPCFMSTPRN